MRLLAVANARAGRAGAAAALERVCRLLRAGGAEVRLEEADSAAECLSLSRRAASEQWDGLLACGGDGMAHWAAQGLAGSQTPLAMLPAGRGNDLARNLNLPQTAEGCAAAILARKTRRLDLLSSRAGWILNVAGAGFDAEINRLANRLAWPRGRAAYSLALLGVLSRLQARHFHIIADGETVWSGPAITAVVANGPAYGGGFRIAPAARFDDGRLDLVLVREVRRGALLRALPSLYRGAHGSHPAVRMLQAIQVRIESDPPAPVYADGEPFGTTPLEVKTVPVALRVFTP